MTDAKIKSTLKEITIIVDTREQENSHITGYFDKHGIKYVSQKLDYGDYSFIFPAVPEAGIVESISFEKRIAIERKASLDELSGNLAQGRERFEREFERAKEDKARMILMVEDGSWEKIMKHEYRTDLNERSYLASLFSFSSRYHLDIQFIQEKLSGWFIYSTLVYYMRNELKMLGA